MAFMQNNEALKIIFTRHTVRHFLNKPVAPELFETICRAAMSAPSACNKQMWQFVITTKREELDAMIEFLPNAKMLASAQAAITICGDPAEDFGFTGSRIALPPRKTRCLRRMR